MAAEKESKGDDEIVEEDLNAGETIMYFSKMFVAGDPRGRMRAKVIQVLSGEQEYPIRITTGEVIPNTTFAKRMLDKNGVEIVEPYGGWRRLHTFSLIPGKIDEETSIQKFGKSLKQGKEKAFAEFGKSRTKKSQVSNSQITNFFTPKSAAAPVVVDESADESFVNLKAESPKSKNNHYRSMLDSSDDEKVKTPPRKEKKKKSAEKRSRFEIESSENEQEVKENTTSMSKRNKNPDFSATLDLDHDEKDLFDALLMKPKKKKKKESPPPAIDLANDQEDDYVPKIVALSRSSSTKKKKKASKQKKQLYSRPKKKVETFEFHSDIDSDSDDDVVEIRPPVVRKKKTSKVPKDLERRRKKAQGYSSSESEEEEKASVRKSNDVSSSFANTVPLKKRRSSILPSQSSPRLKVSYQSAGVKSTLPGSSLRKRDGTSALTRWSKSEKRPIMD